MCVCVNSHWSAEDSLTLGGLARAVLAQIEALVGHQQVLAEGDKGAGQEEASEQRWTAQL